MNIHIMNTLYTQDTWWFDMYLYCSLIWVYYACNFLSCLYVAARVDSILIQYIYVHRFFLCLIHTCRPPQPEYQGRRYIYIAVSIVGFTISDLFYIAAVINYALQCQLITFLVNVTVERVRNNCLKIDHVIKVCMVRTVCTWCYIYFSGNQSHSRLFEGVKWTSSIANVTPIICPNSNKHFL